MSSVEYRACAALLYGRYLVPLVAILALACGLAMPASANPNQGPGGPILVITSPAPSAKFGNYFAEILRTEGLNAFAVTDIGAVTPTTLESYDVAILAKMSLTPSQVTMLTDWVNAGGNLIAMDPGQELSSLLGISTVGSSLSNAYIRIDNLTRVGNGIYGGTMQFHGSATLHSLTGASRLATLYSTSTTSTVYPAVTLRNVGLSGGQAAAFSYDLAASIVYTRQGNPAWVNQERDGFAPIRSIDLFYGDAANDPQPNWIDLAKVHVPQADEQQRFLANLITQMTLDRKPLPRFWYLPKAHRAAVVLTGDEHGGAGWTDRFGELQAQSPAGCSIIDWECLRATVYTYPSTPASAAQALAYDAVGFEVALHLTTYCADFTASSIDAAFATQLGEFAVKFPGLSAPATNRTHCIAWSGWATGAKVGFNYGIRLDTNYYYCCAGWVNNTPGHFTGSAMPMRFADLDGSLIDVYQVVTQMTDEGQQAQPFTVDTLLDRALGPDQQFGVYTVNAHTDLSGHEAGVGEAVIASAVSRGVPIVSSRQMLDWLDARNESRFGSLVWNGDQLSFTVFRSAGANGLTAQLPARSATGTLANLTRNGQPVEYAVASLKGLDYAVFNGTAGSYVATYNADDTAPTVVTVIPASGATDISGATVVTAMFNESMDPGSISGATFELRSASNAPVPVSVSYDAEARIARLQPISSLAAGTYTATLRGGTEDPRVKDVLGNALAANFFWSFTVGETPPPGSACPCSVWGPSAVPAVASVNDRDAVELGVRFRASVSGYVTGIRFYKGAANTGTHIGNLWTNGGTLLATATFTNETATGWQTVTFPSPIAIMANTVYVASYFAPNGGWSQNVNYFTSAVTNGPLTLLRDGDAGGNGPFHYGASGGFPDSSWSASNYWVDVVFTTGAAPVTVPNVVNLTQAAATSAITTAGLVVGTVTQQSSATVPSGSVISQSPGSGTSVAAGSAVNLVVSTGAAPVTVPNVVNLTQAAATSAITTAGLVVGTVTQQSSATVPSGSVISQSPGSGTSVAAGSAVNLVVSTGAAPVTVPNVVNLTQAAATSAITTAGLVVGTVTQQSSATVPSGSVISQSPGSGTSVAAGSAVNLVVSTGAAPVTVPNVVNLTQAAATSAITTAGLVVGTVTQQSSATVPSGSVISQSPGSGTSVAAGSAVNLVVSTGAAPVTVPNVVNLTQAAATSAITTAGLVVGTVTQQSSATVPSGSVISQSPGSGTSVAAGSAVNLVVSTGAAPVTVPNVVNLTQAAATSAITTAGLVVGTVTQQSSATVPSGSVISQSPGSGTSVAAGSAVNLVVSTGAAPVTVPNVVNLTQAAATSAITTAGLVVGTVTQQSSATVPSGSVISQSPGSGTSVAAGSAVNLVVSTGAAPVTVPNVVNLTQAAATSAITTAGLVVGTVTQQSSATVPSGSVISQSPGSGTSVAAGSAVNLVVSTGAAPVTVPNVVNLTQAAATSAITTAGLVVGTVTQQSSATVPSGSVISQSPGSGTSVAAGSAVNLVVSTGAAPVTVPNVVNLTQAAATSAITTAGLVVGTVTQQSSATVPSGSVISQSPGSGTSVAAGSAVNLVVSTGAAPVTVPNVVNLTQAAATSAITTAGLVVGTVTQQSSATVPSGSVISQSPGSGTSVAAGSAVNLVVSTGAAPVTVPNVVNLTQAAATSAITTAGLVVGTVTQQSSATVPSGSVISQSPGSGTSVAAGSAVNLVVSTGAAPDTQAPSQPTGFSTSKVNGNPRLTWTASTDNVGVAGYRIHRSTNGTFGPVFTTTTSTTWTDTDVVEATRYTYAIVAFDAAGNSSARSVLRSVTAGAAPTAPTTLRATLVNGNTQVQLTWNASMDNVGVVEYIVYRGTSGNILGPEVARVATPGWIDTTVTTGSGIRYTYAVKARDAANYLSGRSNWSSISVP